MHSTASLSSPAPPLRHLFLRPPPPSVSRFSIPKPLRRRPVSSELCENGPRAKEPDVLNRNTDDRWTEGGSGGDGGGDGGGGKGLDFGWLPAFPHAATASMANFLFGYHIGVMNGPIEAIAHDLRFEGNAILEGLVVSIFIVGAFIGSVGCGTLIDKLGCRRTLQIDTIPLILGALISAHADSADDMLLGRFLVGLGIGVNTVLVPIYISEVSPTRYRGFLGSLCQVGTCLGIITSLSLALYSEGDPHWWRYLLYIASIPGFFLALGMQLAAESPRWLYKVGRTKEAEKVLSNLWEPSEVEKSIEKLKSSVKESDQNAEVGWSELLLAPNNKVALIGGSLFTLQQFAGINGVLYFSSLTFRDVGITSGALASLYVGITNLAGALVASYLVDKEGRKKLLGGSYFGMALSMFLIVYAASSDGEMKDNLSILGTLMYIFMFAIGAGPVTGVIIPELSSNRVRAKVTSFSLAVHWVCNFLVGLFFLDLVRRFGLQPVYTTFGAVSLLSVLFTIQFLVETKGKSLEEIEMSFNSQISAADD